MYETSLVSQGAADRYAIYQETIIGPLTHIEPRLEQVLA